MQNAMRIVVELRGMLYVWDLNDLTRLGLTPRGDEGAFQFAGRRPTSEPLAGSTSARASARRVRR